MMLSTGQVEVVPRSLVLEVLQLEVDGVDVHEGEVLFLKAAFFRSRPVSLVGADALALLRLNLRIPVEGDRVLEQNVVGSSRVGFCPLPLEVHAFLEPNARQLLAVQGS